MQPQPLPQALRAQLRGLSKCPRAIVQTSGLKEWSDAEIARLRSNWMERFLHCRVRWSAFLILLYLVACVLLAASLERYWHWVTTVESVAAAPIRKIDKWTAYSAIQGTARACNSVPTRLVDYWPSSSRVPQGSNLRER